MDAAVYGFSTMDLTGDWSPEWAEAWRVMHNAREGDTVLWGDRKLACEVTDTGQKKDGRQYINALGPHQGGPYHIVEEYNSEGHPAYSTDRDRSAKNLRFVDRWYEHDDSPEGKQITQGEYEQLVEQVSASAQKVRLSSDRGAGEASDEAVLGRHYNQEQLRGVLMHSRRTDVDETTDPRYRNPDYELAIDTLARDVTESQPDAPAPAAEIQDQRDYEMLVDAGATKVEQFVGDPHEAQAGRQAEELVETLIGELSPADWAQIVHHGAVGAPRLVAISDDEELRQIASDTLMGDINEELSNRVREDLRGNQKVAGASEYVTDLAGHELSWDALTTAWGTNLEAAKEEAKDRFGELPTLTDGGAPHTTVDEAKALGIDVLMGYDSWYLDDPGIVDNSATREMVWVDEATGEQLALIGAAEQGGGTTTIPDVDKWSVWHYTPQNDDVKPLFSSDNLGEAYEAAENVITEGEAPELRVMEADGGQAVIEDNLDHEAVGERFLRSSGWSLGNFDIPIPTAAAGSYAATGIIDTVRYAAGLGGRAAAAAGRGVARAGETAGSFVWHNYKRRIGAGVIWLALFTAARGMAAFSKTAFNVIWAEDEAGFSVGYYSRGEKEEDEDLTETEGSFSRTVDKEEFAERLFGEGGERLTYLLGTSESESNEIFEALLDRDIGEVGVMSAAQDILSRRERRYWNREGETRETDTESPSGSRGSSRSRSSSQQRSRGHSSSSGKTVRKGGPAEDFDMSTFGVGEAVDSFLSDEDDPQDPDDFAADDRDDRDDDGGDVPVDTPEGDERDAYSVLAAGADADPDEVPDEVPEAEDDQVVENVEPDPEATPKEQFEEADRDRIHSGDLSDEDREQQTQETDEFLDESGAGGLKPEEESVIGRLRNSDRKELLTFWSEDDLSKTDEHDLSYASKLMREGREEDLAEYLESDRTNLDLSFLDEIDDETSGSQPAPTAPPDDRIERDDPGGQAYDVAAGQDEATDPGAQDELEGDAAYTGAWERDYRGGE